MLFHKDLGANAGVKNCMSHFSMFVPNKSNAKIPNRNTAHSQGIGVSLCRFPNCLVIYPVGPVYCCTGHPSNTISLSALKCYAGFQKFIYEPLEHCDFVYPQGRYWLSPYWTQNNLGYLQNFHQHFGHVSIYRLRGVVNKGLVKVVIMNIPDLKQPCPICLLMRET